MKVPLCLLALSLAAQVSQAQLPDSTLGTWRSALYPENWKPGYNDGKDHFLHDFSYAGYHRGEKPLPEIKGPVFDATGPTYGADPEGEKDSTAAIQGALDAAAKAGGGVVFLPSGTYKVAPPQGAYHALQISGDKVILRGAGPDKTFLFNDDPAMAGKNVILMESNPGPDWWLEGKGELSTPITQDVPNQAFEIPVKDTRGLAVGDVVILRSDLTQRFIDEVKMTGKWKPAGGWSANRTLMFCRRIVKLTPNTITIDVPTRYPMKVEDLARVVKMKGRFLTESALEDFSIGMRQNPGQGGNNENDWNVAGTMGHDVHGSHAILVRNVENCWVRRVKTYAPAGNDPTVHVNSNGIALARCRFVTVTDCEFDFSQYKGGGGNGYLYCMQGQENLLVNCRAEGGRHNYDFGTMAASGNVISHCFTKDGIHASDFHMFLSMSNLLECITCDGDMLEARFFRPFGGNPVHGVTTTQSVFWNNKGLRYGRERPALIWSEQVGNGYVIGTSGPCHDVNSNNFVEGVGKGDTLRPESLYLDQLKRRLGPGVH